MKCGIMEDVQECDNSEHPLCDPSGVCGTGRIFLQCLSERSECVLRGISFWGVSLQVATSPGRCELAGHLSAETAGESHSRIGSARACGTGAEHLLNVQCHIFSVDNVVIWPLSNRVELWNIFCRYIPDFIECLCMPASVLKILCVYLHYIAQFIFCSTVPQYQENNGK